MRSTPGSVPQSWVGYALSTPSLPESSVFSRLWPVFALLVLQATTPVFAWATASERPLRVVADDWCPYTCADASVGKGFMAGWVMAVLAAQQRPVKFEVVSWPRALRDVRNGAYDLIVGVSTQEAEGLPRMRRAMAETQPCFYGRKGEGWRFNGLADLPQRRVGVPVDYHFDAALDRYIAEKKNSDRVQVVVSESPLATNVARLRAGRIDSFINSQAVFAWRRSQDDSLADVEEQGCYPYRQALFVGFSPRMKEGAVLPALFDAELERWQKDGRWAALLKRYGLEVSKTHTP